MCFNLHRHQVHLISYGCVSFSLITTGLVFTIFAIFQKDSQIGKVWLAGPTTMVVGLVLCGKVIIDWGPAMMHGKKGSLNSFNQLTLPVNGFTPSENYNSSATNFDTQLKESQHMQNLFYDNQQTNNYSFYDTSCSKTNSLNKYGVTPINKSASTIIDFNGVTGLILPSTSLDNNKINMLNNYYRTNNELKKVSNSKNTFAPHSNMSKLSFLCKNNKINSPLVDSKNFLIYSNDRVNNKKPKKNVNNLVDSSTQTYTAMSISPINFKNCCMCNVEELENFNQRINNLNKLINIFPPKVTIFQRNCMNCIKNCNTCTELNNEKISKINALYMINDKELETNYDNHNNYIDNKNLYNANNDLFDKSKKLPISPLNKNLLPSTANNTNKSYQGETFVINKRSFFYLTIT